MVEVYGEVTECGEDMELCPGAWNCGSEEGGFFSEDRKHELSREMKGASQVD